MRIIVLTDYPSREPNESRIDTKVDMLDNFIRAHYTLERRYGSYEAWIKKG